MAGQSRVSIISVSHLASVSLTIDILNEIFDGDVMAEDGPIRLIRAIFPKYLFYADEPLRPRTESMSIALKGLAERQLRIDYSNLLRICVQRSVCLLSIHGR